MPYSGRLHAARRVDVRKPEELAALGGRPRAMWELSLEDWQRVFSVNVFGILNGIPRSSRGCWLTGSPRTSSTPPP